MSCPPFDESDASVSASSPASFTTIDSRTLTANVLLAPGDREPLAIVPPSVATTALVQAVAAWDDVTLAPYENSAVVFERQSKEIGHIQPNGFLSVPLPMSVRDALVDVATSIPYSSDPSGIITLHMETAADVRCGAFFLRLSYLYRSIIACRTPRHLAALRADVAALELPPRLHEMYEIALDRRAATFA
ncbi:hypothetical protein CRI94_13770 [Longibacter salinarum]|uniref:Luciferase domain-containing protein n=1 Tax=Longibacter salinarum TaxID=1850348 RepID=A0A2A8CV64_9BACT|nr:luciferase family protein [Longibacter salinarum]PEN12582.1 hypothetical protein CRI94_13770 [Longibacter salinarum]